MPCYGGCVNRKVESTALLVRGSALLIGWIADVSVDSQRSAGELAMKRSTLGTVLIVATILTGCAEVEPYKGPERFLTIGTGGVTGV